MIYINNILKYYDFINEATLYSLRLGSYVICTKNFRGVKYAKDKIAKIINKRWRHNGYILTLKFDENLIDSRVLPDNGDGPILTDTIEITQNQISGLIAISERDYRRYIDGFRMELKFNTELNSIIRSGRFNGIFSKFYKKSYFDIVDEKTISYLSIDNDDKVDVNNKYTSNLRETFSVMEFFIEIYPFANYDLNNYILENNLNIYNSILGDLIRFKKGFIPYKASILFETLIKMSNFKIKFKYNDVSYIDMIDKNTVTFLTPYLYKKINNPNDNNELYNSKLRQNTKIGRLLKKLNEDYSESEIENFGNIVKSKYEIIKSENEVVVLTGDDITFWYNVTNYCIGNGTLQNSCMRYNKNEIIERVSMYSKYPDKIAMAALINKEGKLAARALIWRLDKPEGVIFMDRIYYTLPEQELILVDYALRNKMVTKYSGFNLNHKMEVNLNEPFTKKPPYLDSFKFYNQYTLINNNDI